MNKRFYTLALTALLLGTSVEQVVLAQKPATTAVSELDKPIPLNPNVRTGKLANGMTYYIQKNATPEKRAELRLAVNAGSILEDDSQQGLAHFTEHMAFNGTKNFKKNELINYLQSVGVKFGAHLNAYTGFDETVYILPIPTDKEEIVDKSLLILEDWAFNVTFEGEEIDKERGVIIEEKRSRQEAGMRMAYQYFPVLFKDSKYAQRLPIGTDEVLKNFKHEEIRRFYKDWYRPDMMAIAIVGDIDVDAMEKKIQANFGKYKAATNPKERKSFDIPNHKETLVSIVRDKEATMPGVQLHYKKDAQKLNTLNDMRNKLARDMYNGMLNQRLSELQQQADAPFLFASTAYSSLQGLSSKDAYSSYVTTNESGVVRGLKTVAEENERVKRHGFTQSELSRYKTQMMASYERAYNERSKTNSGVYVNQYVANFLDNMPATGIEFQYEFMQKHLEGITLAEVNQLATQWITDDNRVVVITAPAKESVKLPSEAEILAILKDASVADLQPYEDKVTASALMDEAPKAGTITKETKNEKLGVTELTLSNGVRVVLKPTDFKDDEILMSAFSHGGHSLYSDADYYTASFTSEIMSRSGMKDMSAVDLRKVLAGKNANVSAYVSELREGLSGNTTPKDLETMLQLTYLKFTAPRKSEQDFQAFINQYNGILPNLMASPQNYFSDQVARIQTQDHLRGGGLPTVEHLQQISLDRAYEIYQDRFADASDFTFTFVGNFDVEQMKPMLQTYLGSLPATNRKENFKDVGKRAPKGVVTKELVKGTDQKSNVMISFRDDAKYSKESSYHLSALSEVMKIRLTEKLREEIGGVYGTSVSAGANRYPTQGYAFNIGFTCAPENVDKLVAATFEEIKKLQKNGATEADLNKVKEGDRRSIETSMRENRAWLSSLENAYYYGDKPTAMTDKLTMVEKLSSKDISKAAKNYLKMNNYIKVVMNPEPVQ
jgi:zinc protease